MILQNKIKKPPRQPRIRGFSLIELVIVMIIIAIIIAGVFAADNLLRRVRISAAKTLTLASPINNLTGIALWFETSLDSSFNSSDANNGASIGTWYDNRASTNKNNATQSSGASQPTYSNTINRVHAVAFDGTNSYFDVNGSFLNNSDYTIFVTEKRQSNKADNYFIGDSSLNTVNQTLVLGYSANNKVIHSQGTANSYLSTVSTYEESADKPRIFTFISDSSGKRTYINGILSGQSSNTTKLSGITTLKIGKGYQGEIGELIAFNRALKISELQDVIKYFSGKWEEPIFFNAASCTNGTITQAGCDFTTCSVSLAGTNTTSVAKGSGSLTCDATGYNSSNTVPYTCSGGVFSTTGNCGSCISGYTSVSGVCQANCSITGVAGVANTTVNAGTSGSAPCAAGHSGSGVSYNCVNGSANLGTPNCTAITCTIAAANGFAAQSGLAYADTATAITSPCQGGYTPSTSPVPSYVCTNTGAASLSGSCNIPTAHWVEIGLVNGVYYLNGASYFSHGNRSPATCDATTNQKYIVADIIDMYAPYPGPVGNSWTLTQAYNGSAARLLGWGDCYTTTPYNHYSCYSNGNARNAIQTSTADSIHLWQCQFY